MDKIEKAFLLSLLIVSAILVLYPQVTSFIDTKNTLSQMLSGQTELVEKTLNNALMQIVGLVILFVALILALIFIDSKEDKKEE
jgi:hypothetical protein